MLKSIRDWWPLFKRKVRCRFKGHDLEPTGRDCYVLKEWRCRRCKLPFVSNTQFPGGLMPGDEESDSLFNVAKEANEWLHTDAGKTWTEEQREKPVAPMDPKA
jgi:hypothetical protein